MLAALSASGVAVYDMTGAPRTSFTNTEQIILQQTVSNSASSPNHITFTFSILSPSGIKVFKHSGNAAPGSVGTAQTQVAGIPISQFYTQPGAYTLVGQAALDSFSVSQQITFTVSSPNITLIYPPNGAQGLSDDPLIFRWVASGASKYRISVDIDPSFYLNLFSQDVVGDSSFAYPDNPPDSRQKLSAGQVYYWKVAGLDANGNKISDSGVPFTFTVKGQAAALTRDLAVTDLSIVPPATASSPGSLPFNVTIANQGGTTESNIKLDFTLGGLPAPESPQIVSLGPGQSQEFKFTAALPTGISQALAIACLEIFDDNIPNNCRTLQIGTSAPPGSSGSQNYSLDQIWDILQKALGSSDIVQALQGYQLTDISGISNQDLLQVLPSIANGTAKINAPQTPESFAPTPIPVSTAPEVGAPAPQAGPIAAPEPQQGTGGQEWSGRTAYLTPLKRRIVIRDSYSWEKFWKSLTREAVPDVNFKDSTVVAVVAGTKTRAEWVQIQDVETQDNKIVVRYRFSGRPKGRQTSVPYHIKVIPRYDGKVFFRQIK